jgi:hypothetical protein
VFAIAAFVRHLLDRPPGVLRRTIKNLNIPAEVSRGFFCAGKSWS